MVRYKSTSRFSSIKSINSRRQAITSKNTYIHTSGSDGLPSPVILTQTDTTVGFLSQDYNKLSKIKSRPASKPFIKIYNSFLACENRIPHAKKSFVRRAKKTTFIVKNRAFRISPHAKNSQILRDLEWHYSTSANAASKNFNREFCESKADIIIEDKDGLSELSSSSIIKLTNHKIRKLR